MTAKTVVALLVQNRGVDGTAAIMNASISPLSLVYGWAKELAAIHQKITVAADTRAHGIAEHERWHPLRREIKMFQKHAYGDHKYLRDYCDRSLF